jgi:hypothetical protein
MHGIQGICPVPVGRERQVQRPPDVAHHRPPHCSPHQQPAQPRPTQRLIADEERHHEGRLETADAAARLIDAYAAIRQLDHAALLLRGDAQEVEQFHIHEGHQSLQAENDGVPDNARNGNCD